VKQVGSQFELQYSSSLTSSSSFIPTERARRPAAAGLRGQPATAAIAVWSRDGGPWSNRSDIHCARWEGSAWTAPVLVKLQSWADRNPDIAARSGSHTMTPEP
jgi:hypothetical protein